MQKLTKVFDIGGRPIRVFSRRFLARMVGKSVRTVSRWTTDGWVPPPAMKFGDPFNWYLGDEVEIWVRAYVLDDIRAGVLIDQSYFSLTVLAEVQQLKENVGKRGAGFLKDCIDLAVFVVYLKELRNMLDWKQQRTMRGERKDTWR